MSTIDFHRNTPFPDKGGNNYYKPDTDVTQCSKLLFVDPLNLNLVGKLNLNLLGYILVLKYINTHKYVGVKEDQRNTKTDLDKSDRVPATTM